MRGTRGVGAAQAAKKEVTTTHQASSYSINRRQENNVKRGPRPPVSSLARSGSTYEIKPRRISQPRDGRIGFLRLTRVRSCGDVKRSGVGWSLGRCPLSVRYLPSARKQTRKSGSRASRDAYAISRLV